MTRRSGGTGGGTQKETRDVSRFRWRGFIRFRQFFIRARRFLHRQRLTSALRNSARYRIRSAT